MMNKAVEAITKALEYQKKYRLDGNYSSGFSELESGDCCNKCKLTEQDFTGRADALKALCGCKDPFQINCQCHIPFRKVAVAAIINQLENLLWTIERQK